MSVWRVSSIVLHIADRVHSINALALTERSSLWSRCWWSGFTVLWVHGQTTIKPSCQEGAKPMCLSNGRMMNAHLAWTSKHVWSRALASTPSALMLVLCSGLHGCRQMFVSGKQCTEWERVVAIRQHHYTWWSRESGIISSFDRIGWWKRYALWKGYSHHQSGSTMRLAFDYTHKPVVSFSIQSCVCLFALILSTLLLILYCPFFVLCPSLFVWSGHGQNILILAAQQPPKVQMTFVSVTLFSRFAAVLSVCLLPVSIGSMNIHQLHLE